jgi:predicted  nucleic acid-binding Zn-ribbon protein
MLFRNFYRCARCDHMCTDVWSATCDDDCPHCGARHMSPYKSEDVQDSPSAVDAHLASERNDRNDKSDCGHAVGSHHVSADAHL